MKRKFLALTLSLVLAFSFSACGGSSEATLNEWYNGEARTTLENTINTLFAESGLTFFVTVEEPDVIIYNYKYTTQLDLSSVSQADIDAQFASSVDSAAIQSDIKTYQSTYDLPVKTIRIKYLNADDTVIFTHDVTAE